MQDYSVELFDYLPIKYSYPNENVIVALGPQTISDNNFNLVDRYSIDSVDKRINNYKPTSENQSSFGWHDTFTDHKGYIESFHAEIQKHGSKRTNYIPYFWPLWHDAIGESLGVSVNKTYIHHCDNNFAILDQAAYSMLQVRPKYCVILLDTWTKIPVLGYQSSLANRPTDRVDEVSMKIDDALFATHEDYAKFNQTFCRPLFDKINFLYLLSKEIGTTTIIAQAVHPFEDLGFNHPQHWTLFNTILEKTLVGSDMSNNSLEERLHFIGWPFVPELGGELAIKNDIEHTIPFCYNLPNEKGHQHIANLFLDKLKEIKQRF